MSTRFQLPCSCGETIPVARSQAGLDVTCPQCRQQQRVPKLARLQELPRIVEETDAHHWGTAQLLTFAGIVITLLGLVMAAWKWYSLGPSPMSHMERLYGPPPEDFSPAETLLFWEQIQREGLDPRFPVPPGAQNFESLQNNWLAHRTWVWIWLAMAGVGLLVSAIGLLEAPRRPPRSAGQAATTPPQS